MHEALKTRAQREDEEEEKEEEARKIIESYRRSRLCLRMINAVITDIHTYTHISH